jgi:hypothetical protein
MTRKTRFNTAEMTQKRRKSNGVYVLRPLW